MNQQNNQSPEQNSGDNQPATGMGVQDFLNEVDEVNNSFQNDRKKVNLSELTSFWFKIYIPSPFLCLTLNFFEFAINSLALEKNQKKPL